MTPALERDEERRLSRLWKGLGEPMGELPTYVDYSIRSITSILMSASGLLHREWPEGEGAANPGRAEARLLVEQLEESCRRIHSVSGDAYYLRTRPYAKPESVDLQQLVDSVLRITRVEVERTARLEKDYESPLPEVVGGRSWLGQVFFSLVIDALAIMRADTSRKHVLGVRIRKREEGVLVTLSASGDGLPSEELPHLFDPIRRSPFPGSGQWIGLSISHALVQAMGGRLWVENQPDSGVSFSVYLPAGGQVPEEGETRLQLSSALSTLVSGGEPCLRALQNDQLNATRALLACVSVEALSLVRALRSLFKRMLGNEAMRAMGIEYLRRRLRYFVRPVSSFRRRIRDLRHLRYRAPERPLFLGVQGCLDAALRITHDELARTARLEQDFTSALPTVLGGDGHLRLVFLLLIRTALQAMARDSSRQHVLRVRTRWEDGWARVSFSDTSQGISEKQWPFILDEGHLHTPNDSIEAHGLPISRAILQAMGGELQVESQEGGGITYTVLLPEAKRTRSESPSPP